MRRRLTENDFKFIEQRFLISPTPISSTSFASTDPNSTQMSTSYSLNTTSEITSDNYSTQSTALVKNFVPLKKFSKG